MKKIASFLFFLGSLITSAQNCVDSTLIDPEMICTMIYDPVCGCNGVTYSNECVATYQGGVTSYTSGECGSIECIDLGGIDFGMCDMVLGIALINGSCVSVSGCGWVVNEVDYSPYFYQNIEDCEIGCDVGGGDSCINQWQIEQGFTVDCFDLYDPVCGCNGVSYSNACEAYFYGGVATYGLGHCDSLPDNCQVIPSYVDFGDCEMPLGYARQEGLMCEFISGCGYIGNNGYDYSDFFFESEYACNNFCIGNVVIDCIDSTMINPGILCPAIYDPVCGCDSVTYENSCEAMYHNGVAFFTPGACPTNGISDIKNGALKLFPNPATDELWIEAKGNSISQIALQDIHGKLVLTTSIQAGNRIRLDLQNVEPGMYLVMATHVDGSMSCNRFVVE
ncbi:MAG: Kazal-type serine protease inhibitor domain-containing protein [Flavobacteriales bacterium]